MARHSKWHNIKHRKAASDSKRGKIFTRHAKLISIAAKNGADPNMNPLLRAAIDNAKAANLPNDNIERAIKKGSGEGKNGVVYEEIIYDAFGPGGVAMQILALTDNRNRALTNIKIILNKKGGRFADLGSVSWMFKKVGQISIAWENELTEEDEMILIEAGAQDWEFDGENLRVFTAMEEMAVVAEKLRASWQKPFGQELVLTAENKVDLPEESEELIALERLIEALEEDEDVDQVFVNLA